MSNRVPEAFLNHLAPHLGGEEELNRLREACARPLPLTFRLLPRPEIAIDVTAALEPEGTRLTPLAFATDGQRREGRGPAPGASLEHALGLAYVQEAASMISGEALLRAAPSNPRIVLDLCAAPGSKTTQIARGFGGEATVIANEPSRSRLKTLAANLSRTRTDALITIGDGRETASALRGRSDAVLVDAPCSGEGTVRRDPKALRGWNRKRFRRFARLQTELLLAGLDALRPGGVLVYSTCALSPEENHAVVAAALEARPHLARLDLRPLFPELAASHDDEGQLWVMPHHHDTGGFFVAALRREEDEANGEGTPVGRGLTERPEDRAHFLDLARSYGLGDETLSDRLVLERGDGLVAARRLDLERLGPTTGLNLNRLGPRIADLDGGEPRPTLDFLRATASAMTAGVIDVDRDLARHLLQGNAPPAELLDAAPDVTAARPLAVRYAGAGICFVGRRQGRPINLLPRSWILPRVD